MRVTDELVRHALTWARNYGEIESFKSVRPSGRRWLVDVGRVLCLTNSPPPGFWPAHDLVPAQMVLTSREALVFAYGCAVGGHGVRARHEWTQEDWKAQQAARRQAMKP